jgi:hypothetical protein
MDLNPDFSDMLKCLNAQGVEYLVVGSFALALHGRPRVTGDIDLLVRPSSENAQRIMRALAEFGMALPGLNASDFSKPDQIVQLGFPPVRIDLITSITGVTWDEAWQGRVSGKMGGHPVHYLGLREFIANKKATGRAKDLGDIDSLDVI